MNKKYIISALCFVASFLSVSAQSESFFADFAVKYDGSYYNTNSFGVANGKVIVGSQEFNAIHGEKKEVEFFNNVLYCVPGTLTKDLITQAAATKSLNMHGKINDEEDLYCFFGFFYGMLGETTSADLSHLDMSALTSLFGLFYSAMHLKNINWGKQDLSRVKDLSYTFGENMSLPALPSFKDLSLTNVEVMQYTFWHCNLFKIADFCGFSFDKLTDCKGLFFECSSLETVSFKDCGLSLLENTTKMFSSCIKLKEVDFSGCDLSKVTSTDEMFSECHELTTIKVAGCNQKTIELLRMELNGSNGPGGTWNYDETTYTISKVSK